MTRSRSAGVGWEPSINELSRGAFGADSLGYNISGIAGPAMAAVIAGLWQPTAALLALAGAAGLGAALLATLPIPYRPGDARPKPPLSGGMRVIVADPELRAVTAASSLGQLGFGALPVVAAVLASHQHQPAATGWLMTAVAVGGLLGSLLWTWRPISPRRAPSVVMISLIGSGAALAVAAGVSSLPLAAVLFTASGVIGPLTGALFTTRQAHAADEVQAQVFTIGAGLKTASAGAGAALGGALAHLPITIQLLVTAGSPILAGALGAVSLGITARTHDGDARRPFSFMRRVDAGDPAVTRQAQSALVGERVMLVCNDPAPSLLA